MEVYDIKNSNSNQQNITNINPMTEDAVSGEPSGKSGKFDSMSKEELIKNVKKYLILLQKAKSKYDDLAKKCSQLERHKNDHVSSNEVLNNKLKLVENELNEVKAERDEFLQAYKIVQSTQEENLEKFKVMENNFIEVINERDNLKDSYKSLQGKHNTLTIKNKELEEEIECMGMKNETLTSSFKFMQEELNKISQEKKTLENNLKEVQLDLDNNKGTEGSHSEEHNKIQDEHKDCDMKVSELKQTIDELEQEIISLKKLENIENNYLGQLEETKKLCCTLSDENENLLQQLRDLRKEKSKIETDQLDLISTVEEFEIERSKLEETLSLKTSIEYDLREVLNSNKLELNNAYSEIDKLKELHLCESRSQLCHLTDEIKSLQNEKQEMLEKLNYIVFENSNELITNDLLEEEIKKLKNKYKHTQSELEEKMEHNTFLEEEATSLREENKKLKNEMDQRELSLTDLQDKIHELELQTDYLTMEMNIAQEAASSAQMELEDWKKCFAEFKELKAKFQSEFLNLEVYTKKLEVDIESFKEQLRIVSEEKCSLADHLTHLNLKNCEVEETNLHLSQQVTKLTEELAQITIENEKIKQDAIDSAQDLFQSKSQLELVKTKNESLLAELENQKESKTKLLQVVEDTEKMLEETKEALKSFQEQKGDSPESYTFTAENNLDSISSEIRNIDADNNSIKQTNLVNKEFKDLENQSICSQAAENEFHQSELSSENVLEINSNVDVNENTQDKQNQMLLLELKKKEECIYYVENEKKSLSLIIEEKNDLIDHIENRLKQKSEELDQLQKELSELKNCESDDKSSFIELSNKLMLSESEKNDLNNELITLQEMTHKEIKDIKEKMNSVIFEKESLFSELVSIKVSYNLLEEDLLSLKNEKERLLETLEMLQSNLKLLTQQLEDSKQSYIEAINKIQSIECERNELNITLASLREAESIALQNAKDCINNYEAIKNQLELVQKENGEMKNILENMQSEKQEISNKYANVDTKLAEFTLRNESLWAEKENLIKEIEILKNNIGELELKIKLLTEELNGKENLLSDIISEKEHLSDHLATLAEGENVTANKLTENYEKIEALTKLLESVSKEKETILGEFQTLQDIRTVCSSEMATLSLKLEEIIRKYEDSCDEKLQLQQTIESLNQELISTTNDNENCVQQKQILQEKVNILQEEKDSVVYEIERVKYNFEEEKKALQDILQNVEDKMIQSEEKQQKLISTIETLQKHLQQKVLIETEQEDKLNCLKKDLAQQSKDSEATISMLNDEKQSLATENAHLQQELLYTSQKMKENIQKSLNELDITNLQEQLRSSEDKSSKLKLVAVKAKKELAESKNMIKSQLNQIEELTKEMDLHLKENENLKQQLEVLSSSLTSSRVESSQNLENYKSLQIEYDKVQDLLESEKHNTSRFEKDLQTTLVELTNLKGLYVETKLEKENLNKQIEAFIQDKKFLEISRQDLQTNIKSLEKERDSEKVKGEELNQKLFKLQQTVQELESQLKKEQDQLKIIQQELEATQQKAKQHSVMALEIADYETTLSNLNSKITEKEAIIEDCTSEIGRLSMRIESLLAQIDAVEGQKTQAESHTSKLKTFLKKVKLDLGESKQKESKQKHLISELEKQLETINQQCESYKIQISELGGEIQKLQETNRTTTESFQRTVRSLESKVNGLSADLRLSKEELQSCQNEYESYKIRVHNVLKQQKNKSLTSSIEDHDKQEVERLEKIIDQLQAKLQSTSDQLAASVIETETLHEEHDRLLQRHSKLTQDVQDKEKQWNNRLDQLMTENSFHSQQHSEAIQIMQIQNETLSVTYKQQIKTMQEEHKKSLELLQCQLDLTEGEIYRLQREQQFQNIKTSRPELPHLDIVQAEERQEGEGSEYTDTGPATPQRNSSVSGVGSSPVPLEKLLNFSDEKSDSNMIFDEQTLKANMVAATKKMEHLSELLNECEATNMRLSEQTRVLKEEIRRLERNQEREKHITNMEYLKNIFIKFFTLKPGDERVQLVTVINTILKLSPEEKQQIVAVAKGEDVGETSNSASWSGYLHRWSGLM